MPLGLDCSDNEDRWIEVEVGKGIILYIVFLLRWKLVKKKKSTIHGGEGRGLDWRLT